MPSTMRQHAQYQAATRPVPSGNMPNAMRQHAQLLSHQHDNLHEQKLFYKPLLITYSINLC